MAARRSCGGGVWRSVGRGWVPFVGSSGLLVLSLSWCARGGSRAAPLVPWSRFDGGTRVVGTSAFRRRDRRPRWFGAVPRPVRRGLSLTAVAPTPTRTLKHDTTHPPSRARRPDNAPGTPARHHTPFPVGRGGAGDSSRWRCAAFSRRSRSRSRRRRSSRCSGSTSRTRSPRCASTTTPPSSRCARRASRGSPRCVRVKVTMAWHNSGVVCV